jgi:hypothetical protein
LGWSNLTPTTTLFAALIFVKVGLPATSTPVAAVKVVPELVHLSLAGAALVVVAGAPATVVPLVVGSSSEPQAGRASNRVPTPRRVAVRRSVMFWKSSFAGC